MKLTTFVVGMALAFVFDIGFTVIFYIDLKRKGDCVKKDLEKHSIAMGRVEEIKERMNLKSAQPIILYDVLYSYLDEMNRERQGSFIWSKKNIWNIGDEIKVYYDPENEDVKSFTDYEVTQYNEKIALFSGMLVVIHTFLLGALVYGLHVRG